MIDKVKQGKSNRRKGSAFELDVRHELESLGWILCKWQNQVNLKENKLEPAKHKFNPFKKVMTLSSGFPDFVAFKRACCNECSEPCGYTVIGVEAKSNGCLDKEEKEKIKWLLDNHIFKYILIASKIKLLPKSRQIDEDKKINYLMIRKDDIRLPEGSEDEINKMEVK